MTTPQYYSRTLVVLIIIIIIGYRRTEADEPSDNINNCDTTVIASCGNYTLPIEFPFWMTSEGNNTRCGYRGFEIKCNNQKQPLLNLPESGDFVVNGIENDEQTILINDQEKCLPRRIMLNRGFSLADSPFQLADGFSYQNYSFYSCPYDPTSPRMIECLGSTRNNLSYSVLAVLSSQVTRQRLLNNSSSCHFITSALAPVPSYVRYEVFWMSYDVNIRLRWNEPDCTSCIQSGGRCGLLPNSNDDHAACYDLPHQGQGLSRKARFGLTIGVGIPGVMGIIGLICLLQRRKMRRDQRQQSSRTQPEFSIMIVPPPPAVLMGLDGPSIERYPKIEVGENGQLPRPNDTICSICLSEYSPKEVLRTITECQHYFHVDCIDGWLKMNATCPLCRKLPARSNSNYDSSVPFPPSSS
ncbi:RING-H2 finger protein ATL20-like [Arachis stenosperma]|uniref:RING-H2 finger protein ATL20-like n=1 Tax=Arachis stenosperma TaxID=217475 RepID=UPI0025ACEF16|nr:RING-H2 finger protein ATL20-like [Arachis stenosperma]